jgi:surface antigen
MKKIYLFIVIFIIAFGGTTLLIKKLKANNAIPEIFKTDKKAKTKYQIGDALDSLNNVKVYYNGAVSHVKQRNTKDGYNLGLEYQCVEFVKRYYYEYYQHKMPDSYGHAKSFFNSNIKDGQVNKARALTQYNNPSKSKLQVGDLVVFDGTMFNKYGHVAIISKVNESDIEIIQQNPGATAPSRVKFLLKQTSNKHWQIENKRLLGWLRKE